MKKFAFLILIATVVISSCAKVYNSPEAKLISNRHEIIAIAPPVVSIKASKKVDKETLVEQQKSDARNFQKEMYSWMLKRKMQNKINVEILDIETTNAKLRKAGYYDGEIYTPSEIAEILGVDGLLTSNYALSKPMSEGAAVAVGLLVDVWGATNKTTVTLSLHDKQTKKMFWNYNHKLSGGLGSSSDDLVDDLMRSASKKMPYKN